MHFKDKVVWITGASSGIGEALAVRLSALGAMVILTARNANALHIVAASCTAPSHVLPADLSNTALLSALVADAVALRGRVDVVIHSAGVSQRSLAEDTDEAIYRRLMEINFFAPVMISKYLLPHFRAQGGGQIVAISSVAGLFGVPLRTGYSAAKSALKGWAESLQTEHTIPGLRITLVFPGRIHTPISMAALTGDGTPHHRMDKGQLEGIPAAICAAKIIRAAERGKQRVIIARGERLLWWLWALVPALYYRIARRSAAQE